MFKRLFQKGNPFYNRNLNYKGKLELITPGKITGWVGLENIHLEVIQIFLNNKLLAEGLVNIKRLDVRKKHNIQEDSGFIISLPNEYIFEGVNPEIKLIAKGWKYDFKIEIELKSLLKNNKSIIKKIMKSNLLGLDGNIDNADSDGIVSGWVSRRNKKQVSSVWIQTKGLAPLMFLNNDIRIDLKELGYSEKNGFKIDLNDLPTEWSEKEVHFSFDKEGRFLLPQNESIFVPLINIKHNFEDISLLSNDKINFNTQIEKAPNELQEFWQELEEVSSFLDEIEQKTIKLENMEFSKTNKSHNKKKWFNSLENFIKNISSNSE